jgi:uncharacterized protein (TIGR02145 family)
MKKLFFYSLLVLSTLLLLNAGKVNPNKKNVPKKSLKNENISDSGVVINGVKWATRNVAAPGTFTNKPEDAGMFFQWNSRTAWADTDLTTPSEGTIKWNSSWNGGFTSPSASDTWASANNPSPNGFRVPTYEEIRLLLDTKKVTQTWTTQNGVNGMKFTDITNGNSIFLPASGNCNAKGQVKAKGSDGQYWSSTADSRTSAYTLFFYNNDDDLGSDAGTDRTNRVYGFPIRPVAK